MARETMAPAAYPITYDVETQTENRNRLTTAFRVVLGIPQWLLVGEPGSEGSSGGVIGLAATVISVISWFAIVFTGKQPRGLWDFTNFYLRWRGGAVAYLALLRDEYPPFGPGDGSYPARFGVDGFPESRKRLSVALRLIYAIPQLIVLYFLGIAWLVTAIIAWFAILFTGRYPGGLYKFAVGYLRWALRVEAYLLLLRDEYPPFGFD